MFSPLSSVGTKLPDDPLRWNFSRRIPTRDLSIYIYIYIYQQGDQTKRINFFITSTKIKQNNSNVFSLVDPDILVNTMVPIFHAQNLLHILKKRKG